MNLPRIKRRIFEAVKRRPGISAEELRGIVWNDPSGGPENFKCIHVHVWQLNKQLRRFGIEVSGRTGGYRIRSVP